MEISSRTRLIALLGHPVEHSLSPQFHNRIYKQLGLDMVYLAFDVGKGQLSSALDGIRAMNFIGCNITIPYKEEVLGYLDEVDQEAAVIGAVNTVKNRNGYLIGYNTDGMGFLYSMKKRGIGCREKRILLLGAGGAARAIAIYLARENPREILIHNRTLERALVLADTINSYIGMNLARMVQKIPEDVDIIINTTSLGMWPQVEGNPLEGFSLLNKTIVCDIVYNPRKTRMLVQAEKAGCKIVEGVDMLIGQGLKAIEIWTGVKMDQFSYQDTLKSF
ncbi:MAG: shikimate dehydrogenase [Clostridia bacterium]|jgi:shikimate dehydrogenase